MRIPLASLLLVIAAGLLAEETTPPVVRLDVPARLGDREGPLDWVLSRVPSEKDHFPGERLHDRLSRRLYRWAEELTGGKTIGTGSASIYADGFFATPPAPAPLASVYHRGGLVVERSTPARTGTTLDAVTFDAALRDALSWLGKSPRLVFKVFGIERSSRDPDRATVRVLAEAASTGLPSPRQWRASWELEWLADAASPRLVRARTIRFERASCRRRPFTDVTPAALGGTPCYREQFEVGLNAWRQRLDAASGIDIYGHQGVAVGDYDGDGWEDVYVAQPAGLPNRLLRARGDGSFGDVTAEAGLGVLDATGGSLFADLDGDADLDLVVVTDVGVLLFENDNGRAFRSRSFSAAELTAREGASLMGGALSDFDLDGDLDLYVFSYVFWAGAGSKAQSSYPYPYHDANNGAPNFLFRNDGGFRFVDVTAVSGMNVNNRRFSLAASWCDYDDDGDPDLYVANDFGRNNLYRNLGDGTFLDVTDEAGVADTGNGMSVTWSDYDGDGRFDLYVGNMWSAAGSRLASEITGDARGRLESVYRRMARGNSLFRNRGDGTFEDVSLESGAYFGRWSWSSEFGDFDGDGRPDLYVANGFVSNETPFGAKSADL